MDISVEENARQMVQRTIECYEKLDIAISNAGVMGNPVPVHELTKKE